MSAETEKILAWMSDEESRVIYQNRVAFQETYDYDYIQKSIDRFVPKYRERKWLWLSKELKEILSEYENVIVAGGDNGERL